MKKVLRGLYVATCYILGAPVFLVVLVIGFAGLLVECLRDDDGFDREYFKNICDGFWMGLKAGHKTTMLWVRRGNNYSTEELIRALD